MTTHAPHPTRRRRRVLACGLLALLSAVVVAALALPAGAATAPSHRLVSPAAFARVVAEKGTVTIDVRGPGEPFIAGTDLSIAFDTLAARKAKLPAKTTRLAIYCHSGRRSAIAAQTLLRLGYRDIVELKGGVTAWQAAGKKLQPANATGTSGAG